MVTIASGKCHSRFMESREHKVMVTIASGKCHSRFIESRVHQAMVTVGEKLTA